MFRIFCRKYSLHQFHWISTEVLLKPQPRLFSSASSIRKAKWDRSASKSRNEKEDENSEKPLHKPVMLNEVLKVIDPQPNQIIVDMTFGAGGHSKALLDKCPQINLYALDRDPVAYRLATELSHTYKQVRPLLGKFTDLPMLLAAERLNLTNETPPYIDAALIDCGVSSMQFDSSERGFSFSNDGPLDMRMGETSSMSAADVVNNLDEADLCEILTLYGEETRAVEISRAIVESRTRQGPIATTGELANIVASAFGGSDKSRRDKMNRPMNVATKTFQALRIFVNNELNELYNAINILHSLLKPGGVCAVISFHSLEDRIVKRLFHGIKMDEKNNLSLSQRRRQGNNLDNSPSFNLDNESSDLEGKTNKRFDLERSDAVESKSWEALFNRKALLPTREEVDCNPRARSAKLRAARKLDCFKFK